MKRILITLIGLYIILFGSCSTESMLGEEMIKKNTLSIFLTDQEMGADLARSRVGVPPEAGEDQLTSLYLLFFEPSPARDGLFVDYVQIAGPLVMNTTININLVGTEINVTDPYHILAIANIDGIPGKRYLNDLDITPWMLQWVGKKESEVMADATAWTRSGFQINPTGLLMNGRVQKATDQFHVDLLLIRNQARYDVLNNLKEDYDLVSVEIRNSYPSSLIWQKGSLDYTTATGRIPVYYGYNNSANTGPNGVDGKGPLLKDIYGFLYTFENQVPMTTRNDRFTTCLIIGLKARATGTTSYYRANIVPVENSQMIKRNNVYRLTIRNIGGPGAIDQQTAYEYPDHNGLDYVINYWDLNDNGLIVQDGSSILSVPTKTIRIGRDGGAFSYSIFTFTNSKNPVSPLTIRSQAYVPANGTILAALDGNTLNVTALPLGTFETQRTGTIHLSYAGLEATINVIQSISTEDFLVVHLPDGGIPRFPPFGGIASGMIRVEASGDWTAQIFSETSDSFTFKYPSSPTAFTTLESSNDIANLIDNNRFRVYTHSANPDPTIREAFIVVTLDKDPENYAAVIRISQSATGGISIIPSQTTVIFNDMGTGLALIPNNTVSKFNVRPSEYEDTSTPPVTKITDWDYVILQSGSFDDRAQFSVTLFEKDDTNPAGNNIQVKAVGMNTSGRTYTAKLRLYLTPLGSADSQPHVDILLVQQGLSFDLTPNVVPAVPKTGGPTQLISVNTHPSLQWSATITTNSGTAPGGRTLVHHAAQLVDQSGNPIAPTDLKSTSDSFRVIFPKIYYPNREIPITATVTVTVEGMTKSITITQNTLTSNGMVGYGMTGAPAYGGLGNTYNRGWDGTSGTWGLAQIPGYVRSGVGNMNVTNIAANVTYLHVSPHIAGASGTNYNWATINNFITGRDAWTVLTSSGDNSVGPLNNANSPLKKAVYNNIVYTGSANARIYPGHSATKLYQFLFDKANTPLNPGSVTDFYSDGVSTVLPAPWPTTAVVLMTRNNNTDHAMLIIDIRNKFMWIGECQIFWYDTYLTNNRGLLLNNLMFFIANASKYGTHFTDLLLEPGQPGVQPAPWDTYWGANAGVPSK